MRFLLSFRKDGAFDTCGGAFGRVFCLLIGIELLMLLLGFTTVVGLIARLCVTTGGCTAGSGNDVKPSTERGDIPMANELESVATPQSSRSGRVSSSSPAQSM